MTEHWNIETAKALVAPLIKEPGALIEAMHTLQTHFGYVDRAALPMLADSFNLSRAEVYGVFSFYHDFRDTPAGKYTVKICQAEACQAMGADALTAAIKKMLTIDFHETTVDKKISIEPVYCLGNCACAPAMMVDDTVYGRVDEARAKDILEGLKA